MKGIKDLARREALQTRAFCISFHFASAVILSGALLP
jgi:hypothetical protein